MPFWRKKTKAKGASNLTEKELLVLQKAEAEALAEAQVRVLKHQQRSSIVCRYCFLTQPDLGEYGRAC